MLTNINHLLLFFQSQTTTKYTNQNQIHTNHPLLHDKDQQKPTPDLLLLTIIPSSHTTTCVSVSVDFFFQVVSIIYIIQCQVWKQLISYLIISCLTIILTKY